MNGLGPHFGFSGAEHGHQDVCKTMGNHHRTICVSLLREIDVNAPKFELPSAIRAKAAIVKDLHARCLEKEVRDAGSVRGFKRAMIVERKTD